MKVYVIRHGESVNNLEYKWTGHLDVNLTPKGYLDAKKAGEIIKNVNFNKVFSSALKRAVETAKTALPSYEVETSTLLREINVGNLAGNPIDVISIEERRNAGVVGYAKWNGETKEETAKREVLEETGIHIDIIPDFVSKSEYTIQNKIHKSVFVFVAKTNDTQTIIQKEEIEDYIWLTYENAYKNLKFENDKTIMITVEEYKE